MNARLGFAIAAHLDPDVLIIDEVLAVGDLSFQDRAFGRIKDLAQSGIPVVLVSHQLERVSTLCTHAILLEKGRVAKRGTPEECIATYATVLTEQRAGADDGRARIAKLEILSPLPIPSGGHLRYRIRGVIDEDAPDTYDPFHVRIRSARTGKVIFWTLGVNCGMERPPAGEFEAEVELQLNVSPGIYTIETTIQDTGKRQEVSRGPIAHVQVSSSTTFGGAVQLNPRMELVAHRPPKSTGGAADLTYSLAK
jgi:hypothetical protein